MHQARNGQTAAAATDSDGGGSTVPDSQARDAAGRPACQCTSARTQAASGDTAAAGCAAQLQPRQCLLHLAGVGQ